jgi:general secretion pathway protein N
MRWVLPAFGVGVFVAALVVLAPATLIDARLERASGGRLRLAGAEGTLWNGAGWIEVRDARGTSGAAKRIAWRMRAESLLRGRVLAEVWLDEAPQPATLALSFSRIEIANASAHLPAAALGLGMPRLAPLRLSGDVLLDVPHFVLERDRMDGEAMLQWRAAGSALTPITPLGDYEVRFKSVGHALHAALRTLAGPLELDGEGRWSTGAAPNFLVTARVPAQHREQLSPLLGLIAVERAAGTFQLDSSKAAFAP